MLVLGRPLIGVRKAVSVGAFVVGSVGAFAPITCTLSVEAVGISDMVVVFCCIGMATGVAIGLLTY